MPPAVYWSTLVIAPACSCSIRRCQGWPYRLGWRPRGEGCSRQRCWWLGSPGLRVLVWSGFIRKRQAMDRRLPIHLSADVSCHSSPEPSTHLSTESASNLRPHAPTHWSPHPSIHLIPEVSTNWSPEYSTHWSPQHSTHSNPLCATHLIPLLWSCRNHYERDFDHVIKDDQLCWIHKRVSP